MDKDYLTLATSCIGYLSLALNLVCLFVRLVKHIKLSGDNDKFYSHKPSLSILLYIMTAARIAVNASLVWSFVSSKVFQEYEISLIILTSSNIIAALLEFLCCLNQQLPFCLIGNLIIVFQILKSSSNRIIDESDFALLAANVTLLVVQSLFQQFVLQKAIEMTTAQSTLCNVVVENLSEPLIKKEDLSSTLKVQRSPQRYRMANDITITNIAVPQFKEVFKFAKKTVVYMITFNIQQCPSSPSTSPASFSSSSISSAQTPTCSTFKSFREFTAFHRQIQQLYPKVAHKLDQHFPKKNDVQLLSHADLIHRAKSFETYLNSLLEQLQHEKTLSEELLSSFLVQSTKEKPQVVQKPSQIRATKNNSRSCSIETIFEVEGEGDDQLTDTG